MSSLQENYTGCSKKGEGEQIPIGDVVILKEDTSNIMFWRLAIVEQLLPGGDDVVRNTLSKVCRQKRTTTVNKTKCQNICILLKSIRQFRKVIKLKLMRVHQKAQESDKMPLLMENFCEDLGINLGQIFQVFT